MKPTVLLFYFDTMIELKEFKDTIHLQSELDEYLLLKLSDKEGGFSLPQIDIVGIIFDIVDFSVEICSQFIILEIIANQRRVNI
jgi:hypothetical protein